MSAHPPYVELKPTLRLIQSFLTHAMCEYDGMCTDRGPNFYSTPDNIGVVLCRKHEAELRQAGLIVDQKGRINVA